MAQLLDGIRVLDLTRWLAGPVSSMCLGDMGAEVIKIEAPKKGDDSRHVGPDVNGESGYFLSVNRNKKSLVINLKSRKGKEIIQELTKEADVVMENFTPGTMDKFGLDYATLKAINPKIVYASCSGFGQTGPYAKKPAYDAIMQGYGGIMSVTGTADSGPTRVGVSIADLTSGYYLTIGILAALFNREHTGQGQQLEVSLLDCQVAMLENPVMRYFASGATPGPAGNRHPSITPYGAFPTKDGQVIIAVGNDKQWQAFCKAANREQLSRDGRFATNTLRTENYDALEPIINGILQQEATARWIEILEAANVPCGPINTVQDIANDPQVKHREMIMSLSHPSAGEVMVAANPLKFSDTPISSTAPPPLLGEHSEEILTGVLGYGKMALGELEEDGVI